MRYTVFLFLIYVIIFSACRNEYNSGTSKYIAYIGRYTDWQEPGVDKTKFDKLHELALQRYLKDINPKGQQLGLKVFDCKRNGKVSDSIYKVIAKDTNIVVVIDNTWGEHLGSAANTIQQLKIPVIAINADKAGLNYGGQVLFTGNSDLLPHDINAFVQKALKTTEVNFISEEDYPLHTVFLKSFQESGIRVKGQVLVKAKAASIDSVAFYTNVKQLFADPAAQKRLTILNVHSNIGKSLIAYLETHYHHLQLLGHSYIVNTDQLKKFGKKSNNELILISNPNDAISKTLTEDIDDMKSQAPELFESPNHAMFVSRCLDASLLIKHFFEQNPKAKPTQAAFADYLNGLRGSTFADNEEVFEIDSSNSLVPELYFSEYTNGKLNSYPLQLNLDRELIPNLFFGMEIVDIYDININTNSFTSDFYYWVKLDSSNREAEKYIAFQNMKQNESSQELIFEKYDGNIIYKLYKVSGNFYVNFRLADFPFDQQELYITAEILNPSNKLKVSFDQKSFDQETGAIDKFKITEWEKKRFYVTVENTVSKGLHGDPEIEDDKLSEFKNITFRLQVERKVVTPLLEIILPLMMIGIVAIALLMLRDISFENLGEVSIGVFITIVAYSISYSDSTPNTDDLTRADKLFWLTFMSVLISFLIVIVMNSIYKKAEIEGKNLRTTGLIIGCVYLAGAAIALLF